MPLVGIRKRLVTTIASATALVFAVSAFLAGCATQSPAVGSGTGDQPPGMFPMQPATQQGQYIFDAYPIIFWIAVAVFILVEGLLIWIVIRYRRRPTDTELPTQTHGNGLLEIIWTLIPAIIVMGLFVFTVDTLAKVDAPDDTPGGLTVDVTGFQWQWTFDYEEQNLSFTGVGSTGPVMALPINEMVRIRLHAIDVIHSFYVPSVPLQEGRDTRPRQRVRCHRHRGRHIHRPVRRVLWPLPRRHAFHGGGHDAARLRRLGCPAAGRAAQSRHRRRHPGHQPSPSAR